MRVLVADMPEDEPHDRVCGACHNPHDQATPREAERTCASAGCHVRPDTLTPMHQGLAVGVLENCLGCHTAHDFRVRATAAWTATRTSSTRTRDRSGRRPTTGARQPTAATLPFKRSGTP
jgi:hypothetical protein